MTQGDFGHPAIFIIRRGLETEARPEYVEGKSARMPIQSRRRPEGTGRKPVTEGKVLFCVSMTQGDFGHPAIFIIRRGLETEARPEYLERKSARMLI
jgi:uncharacterized Zn-finger protein